MSDLISRSALFNKLASIKASPEANEYKAEVYRIIQELPSEGQTDGDYISRADAIEVLIETIAPPSITLDTLVMRIDALPSARPTDIANAYTDGFVEGAVNEALKRPTGEWNDMEIPCNPYPPIFCVECSACGYRVGRETFLENTFNFCPNCGADMRGGEDE